MLANFLESPTSLLVDGRDHAALAEALRHTDESMPTLVVAEVEDKA